MHHPFSPGNQTIDRNMCWEEENLRLAVNVTETELASNMNALKHIEAFGIQGPNFAKVIL